MHDPAFFIHEPQECVVPGTGAHVGNHARIVHKIAVASKYGPARR